MHATSEPRNGTAVGSPFEPTMFGHLLAGELAAMRARAFIDIDEMADRLGIPPDELKDVEAGRAPILAELIVRWCAVVDADPGRALNRAARYSPPPVSVRVDLALLWPGLPETGGWFKQLAAWTEAALAALPDDGDPVITLDAADLDRMARDMQVPVADLVMTLSDFTPLDP